MRHVNVAAILYPGFLPMRNNLSYLHTNLIEFGKKETNYEIQKLESLNLITF